MPYYESVFIARQDVTATQVDALIGGFCKIIEDHDGKVASVERWGLRSLAYRIKKNRKGHYILVNIDAPSEAIHEMERQMRLNEDVLRYLTIRVDALDKAPSPLAQVGTERTERHVNAAPVEKATSNAGGQSDKDKAETKGDEPVKTKGDKPVEAEGAGEAKASGDDTAKDVKGEDK